MKTIAIFYFYCRSQRRVFWWKIVRKQTFDGGEMKDRAQFKEKQNSVLGASAKDKHC